MTRAKTIRLGVGGALVVLLAGGIAWWWNSREGDPRTWRYWQRRLPQSEAEARAVGVWTSVSEIDEPTPAGVDGAPMFDAIDSRLRAKGLYPGASYRWVLKYNIGAKERAQVLAESRDFGPYLSSILAASRSDAFLWPPTTFDSRRRLRSAEELTRLLINSASLKAMEGDSSQLRPAYQAARAMIKAIGESGYLDGLMGAQSLQWSADQALHSLAQNPKVPTSLVRELVDIVSVPPPTMQRSLRFEAPTLVQRDASTRDSNGLEKLLLRDVALYVDWKTYIAAPKSARMASDQSVSLHDWAHWWPLLVRDPLEISKEPSTQTFAHQGEGWPIEENWLQDMPFLALQQVNKGQALAMELAMVEVILLRREQGVLPKKIAGLPRIPMDVWTGKPFRYCNNGGDFWIWSVGMNLRDEQGKLNKERRQGDDRWVTSATQRVPPPMPNQE
jgi:hypothetical protein